MFITKLSLRRKFFETLFTSKDNNVAKLKRKGNWDAGFNISMIQDLCIKLIYLRKREKKRNYPYFKVQFTFHSFMEAFFFFTFSYSQFSLYFCNSSSLCQTSSYFFTSSCAYALFSKLH